MNTSVKIALAAVCWVSFCFGYGGFSVTASFVDYQGLNQKLTELNINPPPEGWGGSDSFRYKGPLWWLGGHGGGLVGDVTLGGGGAAAVRPAETDSLAAELAGLTGFFEVGYRFAPVDFLWIRPCVDISGAAWVHYAHSHDSFNDPDFSQWYLAWTIGAAPGLELMGKLRYQNYRYVGLFVKANYFLPVVGPQWSQDPDPPSFSIEGFNIQVGLRFGQYPSAFRGLRI